MVPNGAVATAATNTPINVGAIEESNATTVSAMTDMVTATRTFEAFQRVIEAFREADRRVVSSVPG
jgi:flagellar basal body rod protein FlgG